MRLLPCRRAAKYPSIRNSTVQALTTARMSMATKTAIAAASSHAMIVFRQDIKAPRAPSAFDSGLGPTVHSDWLHYGLWPVNPPVESRFPVDS